MVRLKNLASFKNRKFLKEADPIDRIFCLKSALPMLKPIDIFSSTGIITDRWA